MKTPSQSIATVFLLLAAVTIDAGNRAKLYPTLHSSQSLTYLIRLRSGKNVKTESTVAAPMAPNSAQLNARGLLQIAILDAQPSTGKQVLRARGRFLPLNSEVARNNQDGQKSGADAQTAEPSDHAVEFTIALNGLAQNVNGFEILSSDQQQAWQEWLARFAMGWTLPAAGLKPGEKWKSEQAEQASSPIAGLYWTRESVYVREEPCRAMEMSASGEFSQASGPPETCAVILTTATLKQNSSSKDATPGDFKLHGLRTRGTAKGKNEVITYISLRTGLVVRATEEANQFMDVVVLKADGSNRVHYNVGANSHSEVLLVAETPPHHP